MKLVNKFTLWYLCITLTCTFIGTAITYYNIKREVDQAAIERLKSINQMAVEHLKAGTLRDSVVQGRKTKVEKVAAIPAKQFELTEEKSENPTTHKPEYLVTVHSYFAVNDQNLRVTSYGYVSKADEILSGLEVSVLWKWLVLLTMIAISARLVSKIILRPFRKTLDAIENFNLKKKEKIVLSETNTKEFRELNGFVKAMTDKAVDEYVSLKEFTENVSHELQTPVSVISHKLEFLAESDPTDEQALLIADMRESLEKLSRINSTLVLLARLENHEFETTEPLRFCRLINESLSSYEELAELKTITLRKNVAKRVYVQLHPVLGTVLLNNLVSNAIRHNISDGTIDVELTANRLLILNTGLEPEVPTIELFERFKKGNRCSKSIGIGLSIVKQICEIHGFQIDYTYLDGIHRTEIRFTPVAPPANVPPDPTGPVNVPVYLPA